MPDEIMRLAFARKVICLVHFTRAANLASIMEHGIVSRTAAEVAGLITVTSDQYRLDGHPGAVSLSVGFPNYKMFFGLRQQYPNDDWVVLLIQRSVLWEKDCAFYPHNAAQTQMRRRVAQELKSAIAFAAMFEEMEGFPTRADERLLPSDPTDVQAEVLVFETVEPALIYGAAFESVAAIEKYKPLLGDRRTVLGKPGYFSSREYVR